VQGKIIFVLGVAAGYVAGTRVGRQGYENLKKQASQLWQSPQVQKSVSTAGELARDKIPVVGDFVGDLAKDATEQVDVATHKHLADTPDSPSEQGTDDSSSDSPNSPSPDSDSNSGERNV
jgi:hypothetical protein